MALQPPANPPINFFTLPRELRDKIYDYTWSRSQIVCLEPDKTTSHILLTYGPDPLYTYPGIPSWTHVNHQWETEILAQLYRLGRLVLALVPLHAPNPIKKEPVKYFWDNPKYGEVPENWGQKTSTVLKRGEGSCRPVRVEVLRNMKWDRIEFVMNWASRRSNRPCYLGEEEDPDYDAECCTSYCDMKVKDASVITEQFQRFRDIGYAPEHIDIDLKFYPSKGPPKCVYGLSVPDRRILWHLEFLRELASSVESLRVTVLAATDSNENDDEGLNARSDQSLCTLEIEMRDMLEHCREEYRSTCARFLPILTEKCIAMVRSGIGEVEQEKRWNDDEDALVYHYEVRGKRKEPVEVPISREELKEEEGMNLDPNSQKAGKVNIDPRSQRIGEINLDPELQEVREVNLDPEPQEATEEVEIEKKASSMKKRTRSRLTSYIKRLSFVSKKAP